MNRQMKLLMWPVTLGTLRVHNSWQEQICAIAVNMNKINQYGQWLHTEFGHLYGKSIRQLTVNASVLKNANIPEFLNRLSI